MYRIIKIREGIYGLWFKDKGHIMLLNYPHLCLLYRNKKKPIYTLYKSDSMENIIKKYLTILNKNRNDKISLSIFNDNVIVLKSGGNYSCIFYKKDELSIIDKPPYKDIIIHKLKKLLCICIE